MVWETGDTRKVTGEISWARHFAALVEYGKQHGHCNVPLKTFFECAIPAGGIGEGGEMTGEMTMYQGNLGFWLNRQRQARKGQGHSKKLLPEREALLQRLVDEGTHDLAGP